ncbi:hypothetical protein [Streptomyces niveus]|uniref:hypothetical protein n=1 Tax=Streptomyces niveus TaxID=193462 RepID=UPI003689DC21
MTTGYGADERLARAALTRVIEPGDENGGRWLHKFGARGLMEFLTSPEGTDDETLCEVGPRRIRGLRARAAAAAPERDLAAIAAVGGRFVCPGDFNFCGHTMCCPRMGFGGEVVCCGRVVLVLVGGWGHAEGGRDSWMG